MLCRQVHNSQSRASHTVAVIIILLPEITFQLSCIFQILEREMHLLSFGSRNILLNKKMEQWVILTNIRIKNDPIWKRGFHEKL